MIMKFETEKGYKYIENMTDVVLSKVRHSEIMYIKESVLHYAGEYSDKMTDGCVLSDTHYEEYQNKYMYWSLKEYTNCDFLDFNISIEQQTKYLKKCEEKGIAPIVKLAYYRNTKESHYTRCIAYFGWGYLLSDENKTIEVIK